ncbi:craniofacial development protein 2-like [Anthonomus grandis grandis]|uniref:craniofacial development protein 2-like n=1 Tax=Anthonomus grandis grandis TaxID=2921223 RepID=UPI0021653DB7|nr:craniofacial development protein 2-like [Anthonomus grandis grandis]
MDFKTNEIVPQVGRSSRDKSHTSNKVSLKDSGGGKNSSPPLLIQNKFKFHLATYNIRTMRSTEHLEELEVELSHIKWNILGLCETRLPDEKCITLNSGHLLYRNNREDNTHIGGTAIMIHKSIKRLVTKMKSISSRVIYIVLKISKRYSVQIIQEYAPTSSAPDDEVERFYDDISQALTIETAHYKYIIGDFNAKLGVPAGNENQYVGKFGLGCTNERGERLINYLQKESMYCMNSFFKKSEKRRWTWRRPNSNTKNEIDYVLTNRKLNIKDISALNRFDTGSDHRLVRAKIEINVKSERNKLIKIQPFPISKTIQKNRQKFQAELDKKLSNKEALNSLNINDLENRISTDIRTTAKKICAATKKNNSKIKKETRELMAKRRNLEKGNHKYNEINRLIKKKTREDLRQYNTEMITTTIENNKNMKALKTRNNDGRFQIHQLRDANGNIKEDSKDLMDIVKNFYSTLYTGDNPEQAIGVDETILNVGSEDLPDITREKVELALSQMKNGKAPGEDGITAEMIKLEGRTTVEAMTILLNKCMTEGVIPQAWQKAQLTPPVQTSDKDSNK